MNQIGLHLTDDALDAAFPWHIVFDRDLRVLSAGRALHRLLPRIDDGSLDELFVAPEDRLIH